MYRHEVADQPEGQDGLDEDEDRRQPDDARADCWHERVQRRQGEPADDRAGDEQEVPVHRPAIAQVALQDDDEDSRKRQLQADTEDVHGSPLSGVDRNWGRALWDFCGRQRPVATRALWHGEGTLQPHHNVNACQTSPGRHSQLMAACRSRGGAVCDGSTMIAPSSIRESAPGPDTFSRPSIPATVPSRVAGRSAGIPVLRAPRLKRASGYSRRPPA